MKPRPASILRFKSPRSQLHGEGSLKYEPLEPRQMLAGDFSLGALNSGIAVSDDATGAGFILFSEDTVQSRFAGISASNAEHLIAVRLDADQWQYNDDNQWLAFAPDDSDLLVAEVNFGSDKISALHGEASIIQGIEYGFDDGDLWFAANRFDGEVNPGEFEVFGSQISAHADSGLTRSQSNLRDLSRAVLDFESHHKQIPNIAIFDDEGRPLLSWRVQLLPFLGMQDLYDQFHLDEAWNSEHNLTLMNQMPAVFQSDGVNESGHTSLFAVGGEGTMFPLMSERIQTRSIALGGDGLANTLLFVEANPERAAVWSKPYDLTFNAAGPLSGLGGRGEFAAVSVDGRPYQIQDSIDAENFANMVLRDDGNVVDLSEVEPATSRESSFETISLGLETHRQLLGAFPAHAIYSAEGVPLLSWRVALLPYIGHKNLYDQFNLTEPWDSPTNLPLMDLIPNVFVSEGLSTGMTNWLAVSGPGTMFEIADESGVPLDGSSNTLMYVEADLDQAVAWSQPQDLLFESADPSKGLSGLQGDGFYGAFADGNVEFVNSSVSDSTLVSMALREDGGFVNFAEFAPYQSTQENLRSLGLSILNYEAALQELPQHAIYSNDGTPLLSWRVSILPFIDQGELFDQFRLDEPWDSAHNIALLPMMPRIFATPNVENGFTVYVTSNGERTAFPFADERVRLNSFVDGVSNTALVLQSSDDFAVEWTRPADLIFNEADPRNGLSQDLNSGAHFVKADGSLGFLPSLTNSGDVARLLQRNDGDPFVDFDSPATQFDLRQTIFNRTRQAALGANNYYDVFRELPPHAIYSVDGSTPLLSWRVAILPYLGHQSLFEQFNFDEPWDSANNLALLPLMPDVFAHPELENGLTSLLAVTGDNTLFPLENRGSTLEGILDGASNTLLFLQANADQAVEWTRPADLLFDEFDPKFGTGTLFATGTMIALADASGHFVHACIDPASMRDLILTADGNVNDWRAYCNNGTATSGNFFGTDGDDLIEIEVQDDDLVLIVINGDETTLSRSDFEQVVIDGLGGDDEFIFRFAAADNVQDLDAELGVSLVIVEHGGMRFQVANSEFNVVHGGNGFSKAKLQGTDGNDSFDGARDSSSLIGPGYSHTLVGFDRVVADAGEGLDVAAFEDSELDDVFFSDLNVASFQTENIHWLRAVGFDQVMAKSVNGGNDDAKFNLGDSSTSSDLAWVTPEYARLKNASGNVAAFGFRSVFIAVGLGQDVIRITDSAGDDVLSGQQQKGTFRTPELTLDFEGFERTIATADRGGFDVARLKSIGFTNDRLIAAPELVTLSGDDIDFRLQGFNAVDVQGRGGFDIARLTGSEGKDNFFADEFRASLQGDGFGFTISGFESVLGVAGEGGNDTAVLRDSGQDDRLTANWDFVTFQVGNTINQAEGFGQVRAVSSAGNDLAILNDSLGNDFYLSTPTYAFLAGDGFRNIAKGFSRVSAFSREGFDKATARDSAGDDVFVGKPEFSYLRGEGFDNRGTGFAEYRVLAAAGGNDSAYLFDSSGDDVFSGSGNTGWMRSAAHFYLTRGFDLIGANGVNGGVNKNFSKDVDYQLNLNGDWI